MGYARRTDEQAKNQESMVKGFSAAISMTWKYIII